MTVGELINELKKYPEATPVVVRGYEYGLDDAAPVRVVRAHLNTNVNEENNSGKEDWYAGRHSIDSDEEPGGVEVVAIGDIAGH